MRYFVDLRRSRIEVTIITIEADDAVKARIAIDGMVRGGRVPEDGWHEESVGAIMVGSPRRDAP
jgi:hypothetical protein